MKRLTPLCFFAFVLLALSLPAYGQSIPTPAPPGTADTVRAASEAVQTIGALQVAMLLGILVLAAIVVFFVIAALRLGLPLVNTVQKLISSRDDLQRLNADQEREAASYRVRTAEAQEHSAAMQERTARILEGLDSALKKGVDAINEANKDGRIELIKAVNTRIDGTEKALTTTLNTGMNAMQSQLTEAVSTLKDATERIKEFASKHDLVEALAPVTKELTELRVKLTAVEERLFPPPDPASVAPAEKKDDTP